MRSTSLLPRTVTGELQPVAAGWRGSVLPFQLYLAVCMLPCVNTGAAHGAAVAAAAAAGTAVFKDSADE